MSPSAPSPGGVAAALARAARAQPEEPFLFYRDARGQFRWWSFAQAAAFLEAGGVGGEKLSVRGVVVEREAVELLGGFLRAAVSEAEQTAAILDPDPRTERHIWICWRPLTDRTELALARWAIVAGAAILLEPGPTLHPELFAWARPTAVSGRADELCALASQVASLAPRFLRRRWFRQRACRLRLLLVSGPAAAEELAQVEARWRALSPEFAPRVVSLPADALV